MTRARMWMSFFCLAPLACAASTSETSSGGRAGSPANEDDSAAGSGGQANPGGAAGAEAGAGGQGDTRLDAGAAGGGGAGPEAVDAGMPVETRPDVSSLPIFVFAAGGNEVRAYRLDVQQGTLAQTHAVFVGAKLTYGAVHPDGRTLYVCENQANASAHTLAFDGATGKLSSLGKQKLNDARCVYTRVHPKGRFLLSTHFDGNQVSVTPIGLDGKLAAPGAGVPACRAPHLVTTDRTGGFAYVPCRDSAEIFMYTFDAQDGTLALNPAAHTVSGPGENVEGKYGGGPRHLDVHPNNRWAYLLAENGAIVRYPLDEKTGTLRAGVNQPGIAGGAAHIEVTPSGRFVIASTRSGSAGSAVHSYRIDPSTGDLTASQRLTDRDLEGPRDFTIEPGGRFAIVASGSRDKLTVVRIDADTGALTLQGRADAPTGPQWVGAVAVEAP